MKKSIVKTIVFAVILCLILAVPCFAALAEAVVDENGTIEVSLPEEAVNALSDLAGKALLIIGIASIIGIAILVLIIVLIVKAVKKGSGKKNMGPFSTPSVQVKVADPNAPSPEKKKPIDPVNNVTEANGIPNNIPQSASAYSLGDRKDEPSILDTPSTPETTEVVVPDLPSSESAPQQNDFAIPSMPENAGPAPATPAIPDMPSDSAPQENASIPEMPASIPSAETAPVPEMPTSAPSLQDGSSIPSMPEAPAPAPAPTPAPAPAAAPAASRRVCPKCGAPLTTKKATSGPLAGQTLIVCSQYPNCKFMAKMG